MATTQIKNLRIKRDADINDIKALAAKKMTNIRKLRDAKIESIKEKASATIKGAAKNNENTESSPKKLTNIKSRLKNRHFSKSLSKKK